MDKQELRSLSKSDLIRIILAQEERISKLEHHLTMFENAHTPSSKLRKKNTDRDLSKPRFPGKPPGSGGGGIDLPPVDETKVHTLEKDPETGEPLGKPVGYRSQIVIDFADKPLVVTEHRIMQYCLRTGTIIEPTVTLPSGVYGPNLKNIVVMLRALNLSCEKIASLMRELGAPSFSSTTVKDICAEASEQLAPRRNALLQQLRKQPYVHADETGMRQDGKNGYVWGVFSPIIAVFDATLSRARKMITNLLPKYHGVIVTDGYNAYDEFPHRQRCWIHLLREFKEYKDHAEISVQYDRLHRLFETIKTLERPAPDTAIQHAQEEVTDIITCLKTIKEARKLAVLMENGGNEWFTALHHKDVPLDNNHAERGLRPLVLWRKTIGCYRNQKGIDWINNTLSVLYTWKLQKQNIFHNLKTINWN